MNSKIIAFAIKAHTNTNHFYDNDKPYSVHLAMVAQYAQKYIDLIPDVDKAHSDVLDAAWLHDTIEDCRLTYNDVKQVAGERVADIVYAVTNDKGKNRAERASDSHYEAMRNVLWARYVKMCDRLANAAYSNQNQSRMLFAYRKENAGFINHLFPSDNDKRIYAVMISELEILLSPF